MNVLDAVSAPLAKPEKAESSGKVNIDDLENLVLEGGGAKGKIYIGAIAGIEEALKLAYENKPRSDELLKRSAIVDYGAVDKTGKFKPQVNRFAGSSAGAIQSLALALGLDSEQIGEVSEFPFAQFLKDPDVGKYRMVSVNGELCIGEDSGVQLESINIEDGWPVRTVAGRLGAGKNSNERHKLSLDGSVNKKGNPFKAIGRRLILDRVVKIIAGGAFDQLREIWKVIAVWIPSVKESRRGRWKESPEQLLIKVEGMRFSRETFLRFSFKYLVRLVLRVCLRASSNKKHLDLKLNFDSIGNLFWDRGMFSGFAVREFFFDLLLYASCKDTHFHRTYFNEAERRQLRETEEFEAFDFKNGKLRESIKNRTNWSEYFTPSLVSKLEELPEKLTFKEFYKATGIDLIICVTNFSTDQPVYFSQYWTPDFPVAEAVGASMSIPIVIKPVYNECNVISQPLKVEKYWRSSGGKEYFEFNLFQTDQAIIKRELGFDVNTPLTLVGPLAELRRKIEGIVRPGDTKSKISREELCFHYNAAYKGLLVDGGYRCNIPYNIFRVDVVDADNEFKKIDGELTHTLSLKLDNTFPEEWMNKLYKVLEGYETKKFTRDRGTATLAKAEMTIGSVSAEIEEFSQLDKKSKEHVLDAFNDLRRASRQPGASPWNRKKSILSVAAQGFEFGSESGQLHYISDHTKIVPLYSYGVSTLDFDTTEIESLVELGTAKANEKVKAYFGIKTV